MVYGDFNYSKIKWDPALDMNLHKECRDLLPVFDQHGLRQINPHPSREDGNILDLLVLNLPDKYSDVTVKQLPYQSDHFLLDFGLTLKVDRRVNVSRVV